MSTRGQGRVFQQKGSPYWYVAYYAHGQEKREPACHVRTGKKLEAATERNRHEAERFLKHRLGEIAAEQHGGRAFIGPEQARVKVDTLLDGVERDLKRRDKWDAKIESVVKIVRERFGTWRAVDITSEIVGKYIDALREEGYSNATINRRTQILAQAFKLSIRNKQLSEAPYIAKLSEVGNARQGFFETADFEAVIPHLPEYLRDFSRFGFLTYSGRWPWLFTSQLAYGMVDQRCGACRRSLL